MRSKKAGDVQGQKMMSGETILESLTSLYRGLSDRRSEEWISGAAVARPVTMGEVRRGKLAAVN